MGQEHVLPPGTEFIRRAYSAPRPDWDHDHCTIHDSDVGLHAMSALRRVLGPAGALPYVEQVELANRGTQLGKQAERELKKLRKALA